MEDSRVLLTALSAAACYAKATFLVGDGDGLEVRGMASILFCIILSLLCYLQHSYISPSSSSASSDFSHTAHTLLLQNRIQTLATMTATCINTDPKSPDYTVPLKIQGRNFRLIAATKADAPVFADVFWDSFQNDAVSLAMNGSADPEKVAESSKAWTDVWDAKGNAWFKVADDDNGWVFSIPSLWIGTRAQSRACRKTKQS